MPLEIRIHAGKWAPSEHRHKVALYHAGNRGRAREPVTIASRFYLSVRGHPEALSAAADFMGQPRCELQSNHFWFRVDAPGFRESFRRVRAVEPELRVG